MPSKTKAPGLRKSRLDSPRDQKDFLEQIRRDLQTAVSMQDEHGRQLGMRYNRAKGQFEYDWESAWHPTLQGRGMDRVIQRVANSSAVTTVITEATPTDHNDLSGLQGGTMPNEFYHFNEDHHTQLAEFIQAAGYTSTYLPEGYVIDLNIANAGGLKWVGGEEFTRTGASAIDLNAALAASSFLSDAAGYFGFVGGEQITRSASDQLRPSSDWRIADGKAIVFADEVVD